MLLIYFLLCKHVWRMFLISNVWAPTLLNGVSVTPPVSNLQLFRQVSRCNQQHVLHTVWRNTWAQSGTASPERWLHFSAELYSCGPLLHGAVVAVQYRCPAGGCQFPLTRGSGPSTALHFLTPSRRSWKPANDVKLTALCKQNTNREQIKITLSIYVNAWNYWMKSHHFHIRCISMCRRFNILAPASLAY